MTHIFHKRWLKFTAILIGSFGPVFFFGTMATTLEPARSRCRRCSSRR